MADDLERFVQAQEGTYEEALAELRNGHKTGHWIWFILPQIEGLGRSETSRYYALRSLDDARARLRRYIVTEVQYDRPQPLDGWRPRQRHSRSAPDPQEGDMADSGDGASRTDRLDPGAYVGRKPEREAETIPGGIGRKDE